MRCSVRGGFGASIIGQYAVTSTLWFFLTWFPTYLVKYRHFDFVDTRFFSSFPFLAAFVGVLSSGFLSDLLVRKGVSPTTARKIPIISGLLLSSTIVGANFVEDPRLIILFLSIAFFGTGFRVDQLGPRLIPRAREGFSA